MMDSAEMDDDLENFIRERKARVAEDKASLQYDLPYMELKTRPHVATVKENIPPKPAEDDNEGLPLGVEYEKKKQKLQRELRMDYRHYITQKTQEQQSLHRRLFKPHLPDRQGAYIPNFRPPSRRDAATLTGDSRGQSPERDRPRDRIETGVVQDPEETKYNLDFMERIPRSHTQRKAWANKIDSREKREIAYGRRLRAVTRKEEEEFSTGLMIGASNTEEVLQQKKERYRKELDDQIAEQRRNKKRERELELRVAATGVNDPEKPLDRIRQFGLHRRKEATATVETHSIPLNNDKTRPVQTQKDNPPPEVPHVAFQRPLLDYIPASGLGAPGLYQVNHTPGPVYQRPMDNASISLYPPHPPPGLSEVYRPPHYEPHYYGRNPPEPQTPNYHLPVPPGGVYVPSWNLPPGGTVSSPLRSHSPHSPTSVNSFADPPVQASTEVATADSRVGAFPADKPRTSHERRQIYGEALKQQEATAEDKRFDKIQEQQERKRLEREEHERFEAQLEEDLRRHQPWGRGGGGAPLRDRTGKLIADLKQMHRLNEEACLNPGRRGLTPRRPEQPDPNERVNGTESVCSISNDRLNGFTEVQTPQFTRGSLFSAPPTQQQQQEQDLYKACLQQQIEEKQRRKAEEREQLRLEEEKEERRLAEQRAQIQREYQEEQEKRRRKDMEIIAKNEELIHLGEERRKEAERKRKEAEEKEKEKEAQRKQYESEKRARVQEICREPSPPIPTLQKKLQLTPRPPTVESQQSIRLSERSLSGLQSPPVPARRNQLRAAGEQQDVFSTLSALRRRLRTEQRRLHQDEWDELDSPLSTRHRQRPPLDVFDMARLRLQAPVRRPSSRTTAPTNLLRIHDSLQLKYNDADSRLGSGEVPKVETVSGWRNERDPYQFNSERSTVQDDYLDLSQQRQNDLRCALGGSSRGSLLESESAFIDVFPMPVTPEQEKRPTLTARERRRMGKSQQSPQNGDASSHKEDLLPHYRTGTGRRGNTADVSDEDSSPLFASQTRDQSSVQRSIYRHLGTSDTLQMLDRPIRRERLAT